jgi:hypothetical protein
MYCYLLSFVIVGFIFGYIAGWMTFAATPEPFRAHNASRTHADVAPAAAAPKDFAGSERFHNGVDTQNSIKDESHDDQVIKRIKKDE